MLGIIWLKPRALVHLAFSQSCSTPHCFSHARGKAENYYLFSHRGLRGERSRLRGEGTTKSSPSEQITTHAPPATAPADLLTNLNFGGSLNHKPYHSIPHLSSHSHRQHFILTASHQANQRNPSPPHSLYSAKREQYFCVTNFKTIV